jgi:hypothetical protein
MASWHGRPGTEAVNWLVANWPKKLSRAQAVWLGNLLVRANSFSHVTHSFPFMDKEYFYRFYVRVCVCVCDTSLPALT